MSPCPAPCIRPINAPAISPPASRETSTRSWPPAAKDETAYNEIIPTLQTLKRQMQGGLQTLPSSPGLPPRVCVSRVLSPLGIREKYRSSSGNVYNPLAGVRAEEGQRRADELYRRARSSAREARIARAGSALERV